MDRLGSKSILQRSRYVLAAGEEVARLRGENRALLNSLLGTGGISSGGVCGGGEAGGVAAAEEEVVAADAEEE